MFSEAELAWRVEALAREVSAVMPRDLTLVALLKGSFVFAADLLRALGRAGLTPRVDFLRVSSYGLERQSSGSVQFLGPAPAEVAGRQLLLVDDIVDTGRSLDFARNLLLREGAGSVRTCVLLDKPSRREVETPVDFRGFTVEDVFLVGYGIDFAQDYRYLPFVGAID
jgi:hypoxanthine phosphoribosyltransferase